MRVVAGRLLLACFGDWRLDSLSFLEGDVMFGTAFTSLLQNSFSAAAYIDDG